MPKADLGASGASSELPRAQNRPPASIRDGFGLILGRMHPGKGGGGEFLERVSDINVAYGVFFPALFLHLLSCLGLFVTVLGCFCFCQTSSAVVSGNVAYGVFFPAVLSTV